jgi:FAD/FMN-containing dehydrogenase
MDSSRRVGRCEWIAEDSGVRGRAYAGQPGMGANTERHYRQALTRAELLDGSAESTAAERVRALRLPARFHETGAGRLDLLDRSDEVLRCGEEIDTKAIAAGLDCAASPATEESSSYAAYATRLVAMEKAMKGAGTWSAHHPWMDLLLPADKAPEIIAATLARLDPQLVADADLMTYPLRRAASTAPLLPLPDSAHAFLFDVLPSVRAQGDLAAFDAVYRAVFERATALGARFYPIGYPVGTDLMTEACWKHQFGAAWERLGAAKRRYDPDGLLTPGYGMFPEATRP